MRLGRLSAPLPHERTLGSKRQYLRYRHIVFVPFENQRAFRPQDAEAFSEAEAQHLFPVAFELSVFLGLPALLSSAHQMRRVEYHEREYGIEYIYAMDALPADKCSNVIFPTANRFASARKELKGASRQNMVFRTPEDDVVTHNFFISLHPREDGKLVHHDAVPPDRPFPTQWVPTELDKIGRAHV